MQIDPKKYDQNNVQSPGKPTTESRPADIRTNNSESQPDNLKSTTGTGLSQAERSGVDPRTEGISHEGSDALAAKYNIDEQARLDSSAEDFHKTTSNFHHSDGSVPRNDEEL